MINKQLQLFQTKLQTFIEDKELIKLLLSSKRDKSSDLKNIIITIVKLKKGYHLNFVYRHNTKDITKNYEIEEGLDKIKEALMSDFYNAEVLANKENLHLYILPNDKVKLKISEPTLQPLTTFNHDKVKDRLINTKDNIYLRELSVVNKKGKVLHEMTDKYRQINRYVELLAPYLKGIKTESKLHLTDMGSGKGYLTFALYDYLMNNQSKAIEMTGVEFREALVKESNRIAKKAGFENLKFIQGTIEKANIKELDVLIALHACDTATDEAIFRGIRSEASLIVCAPCCHKQIRKEFNVTNELHNVVRHGILKERQAEIITDTLRAMIMELHGYKTNIFEFITTEHTPKNLMIVGEKKAAISPDKERIEQEISAIKNIYGIEKHYLETLLDR